MNEFGVCILKEKNYSLQRLTTLLILRACVTFEGWRATANTFAVHSHVTVALSYVVIAVVQRSGRVSRPSQKKLEADEDSVEVQKIRKVRSTRGRPDNWDASSTDSAYLSVSSPGSRNLLTYRHDYLRQLGRSRRVGVNTASVLIFKNVNKLKNVEALYIFWHFEIAAKQSRRAL